MKKISKKEPTTKITDEFRITRLLTIYKLQIIYALEERIKCLEGNTSDYGLDRYKKCKQLLELLPKADVYIRKW